MNARCTRLPQVNGVVLTAGRSGPLRNASIYVGSDSSSVQGNLLVAVRACLPACLPACLLQQLLGIVPLLDRSKPAGKSAPYGAVLPAHYNG